MLKYSSVKDFWEFLDFNKSTKDFQPENVQDGVVEIYEVIKTSPVTNSSLYLKQRGVNPDTLILYAGDTIIPSNEYTFDVDTSNISLSGTALARLATNDLRGVYDYCEYGSDLSYAQTMRLLKQAENKIEKETNCFFADQSSTNPNYKNINGEEMVGLGYENNLYQSFWRPLIKLNTTIMTAYVSGGTTLNLVDTAGFPTQGTIYVGGNKVVYTDKSNNNLTVPSTTPSIPLGAIVRGEVIEVSNSPSGLSPNFQVLEPDVDYNVDYDTGEIQLFNSYYYQSDNALRYPQDGIKGRMLLNYFSAWHDVGQNASVPDEIVELVYLLASKKLQERTFFKSLIGQRDNFEPRTLSFSHEDMKETLNRYTVITISNV